MPGGFCGLYKNTRGARYWQMIKPLLMGGRFYFGNNFHPWG